MRTVELPLVVGVDGSESSLRAVDWATDEAALRGVPLRLVYASLWERYEGAALAEGVGRPSEQVMADDIVEAAARRAHRRAPEVKVTTEVLPDDAASVLLNEAHTAAALVVGSRGRSGLAELLLGSVGLTVAGRAACPVIVLRGNQDNQARAGTHRRVVLGVGERRDRTARRSYGSPSRRPRPARPPWTPYGPGAARRTRAPTTPCSRANRPACTSSGPRRSWTRH